MTIETLRIRLEWVRPAKLGPLPVVIVHPEAGYRAADMRGILNDLAAAGYLAVAADYQRRKGNRWRQSLFPWQDPDDPKRVIDRVRAHPDVNRERIGLLGFSQGGVFSLLIAAYSGRAAAVVAYYPVTDFERWLKAPDAELGRRLVFGIIRIGFRRAIGAKSDKELQTLLRRASPFWQATSIRAPVLLVHGDHDGSAEIDDSRRPRAAVSRTQQACRTSCSPWRQSRLQLSRSHPSGPGLGCDSSLPRSPLDARTIFAFP